MMKLWWNCSKDQIWIEKKKEELLKRGLWDPKQRVELDLLVCLLFVGAKLNNKCKRCKFLCFSVEKALRKQN